jgi:hypothetical protein
MAINMDELLRAFGRPVNPNVQPVQDMRVQGMGAQPAIAPAAAPMPQSAPAPAQERRGLLGGFFGPEGRDARARLAIALEGMTMNPNQGLINTLQSGIERRETAAQRNKTVEWLRSQGHSDLADALEAGSVDAASVVNAAIARNQPADPLDAIRLERERIALDRERNPQAPQPEIREVNGRLVAVSPGGAVSEIYAPEAQPEFRRATPEEAAAYGAQGGQFGPDGRFYPVDVPQGMTIESDGAGGFRMVQGPAGAGGSAGGTEGQRAGAGYLQRMTAAEEILRDVERRTGVVAIPTEKALAIGTAAEGYVLNPVEQQLAQAQRDWVRSKLRKESGAVIGPEEMAEEIRTYFPQPGEGAEVVRQKAEARRRAERQMEIGAGAASSAAGAISPEYAPPIRADELGRAGIGTGQDTSGAGRVRTYNPQTGRLE